MKWIYINWLLDIVHYRPDAKMKERIHVGSLKGSEKVESGWYRCVGAALWIIYSASKNPGKSSKAAKNRRWADEWKNLY